MSKIIFQIRGQGSLETENQEWMKSAMPKDTNEKEVSLAISNYKVTGRGTEMKNCVATGEMEPFVERSYSSDIDHSKYSKSEENSARELF